MIRVAIIGSGIAGLAAAHAIAATRGFHVTVFEAASRPGGHVYTVEHHGYSIDLGFIVCNRERYPHFFRLLDQLAIATQPTTMAFSVSLGDRDLEWGSASLSAMFADRRRLASLSHWRFLVAVARLLGRIRRDLDRGGLVGLTLGDYLPAGELREVFAIPLAAALWSLAPARCLDFPAETYARFLDQHGMLRTVRPLAWHTIVGGSRRYVDALLARLPIELALAAAVTAIARDRSGVTVVADRREHRFDRVVIATPADRALAALTAASERERATLGAFAYSANRTVLHTDRGFLPKRPAAHASWNYVADRDSSQVAVTYSMTKLQGLPDRPYLVTLNPRRQPAGVLHEVTFHHPQFDRRALAAQADLPRLAGNRTYYAGAYFGFGFHEDGVRSGLAAAARLIADCAAET